MDTHKTYKAGDSITLLPEWMDEGDCLWTVTVLEIVNLTQALKKKDTA